MGTTLTHIPPSKNENTTRQHLQAAGDDTPRLLQPVALAPDTSPPVAIHTSSPLALVASDRKSRALAQTPTHPARRKHPHSPSRAPSSRGQALP